MKVYIDILNNNQDIITKYNATKDNSNIIEFLTNQAYNKIILFERDRQIVKDIFHLLLKYK